MKKTLLLLVFTASIFIACEKKQTTEYKYVESPKDKFLKEKGLSHMVNLSDSEFETLKKAFELELFKDKTLCQFFEEFKTLEYSKKEDEANEVLKSLEVVEDLTYIIKRKGSALCPKENDKVINSIISKNVKSRNTSYQSVEINPCVMSEDFIKKDLRYPKTADFSMFDCSHEQNSDGSYTILRKVGAKNAFGVESEFIYKITIAFTGGNQYDINDWILIRMQSEEYR